MSWQLRHEGSPQSVSGLTLAQIVEGLRDGRWEPTDQVKGPGDRQWLAIESHPQLAEVAAEVEQGPVVHEDETHIDMNALIDVTMVLLIFFILTTTHATLIQKVVPVPPVDPVTGKRVLLPGQVQKYMVKAEARPDAAGKPVLHVEGRPADVWRDDEHQELDGGRLAALLQPYVQGSPPRTELVLDAERISWGLVIEIQDAARAAGMQKVHHVSRRQDKKKGSGVSK
jgi:biopolymer transport protein ExbD